MATRSKEKAAMRRENAEKRPHATARYIRISSRKVKVVIDLIRGKSVDDAEAILLYTPKATALVLFSSSLMGFYLVLCLLPPAFSIIIPDQSFQNGEGEVG